ncbi:hypothetical protein [Dipodfec virus UOA04_Rod_466]|nr:hypothetical protein [Dipodfec virus UOA04_Rod_466]
MKTKTIVKILKIVSAIVAGILSVIGADAVTNNSLTNLFL